MTPSQILDKAADHIERYGWMAEDWYAADGVTPPEQCAACAGGAINIVAEYAPDYLDHDDTSRPVFGALEALAARLSPHVQEDLEDGDHWDGELLLDVIASWNDAKGRTRDEVVEELRAAAASAREAGR
jgi:hypothetical protein